MIKYKLHANFSLNDVKFDDIVVGNLAMINEEAYLIMNVGKDQLGEFVILLSESRANRCFEWYVG